MSIIRVEKEVKMNKHSPLKTPLMYIITTLYYTLYLPFLFYFTIKYNPLSLPHLTISGTRLTLFPKSFSTFLHSTCSLSVSLLYLALDGLYHPFRAAVPNNLTLQLENTFQETTTTNNNGAFTLYGLSNRKKKNSQIPQNLYCVVFMRFLDL